MTLKNNNMVLSYKTYTSNNKFFMFNGLPIDTLL